MIAARPHLLRRLAPVLAGLLAVLGAFAVSARAEYGGLGALGTLTAGSGGGHGEVNPSAPHAFGVDPADGSYYIGGEIEVEEGGKKKRFIQVQKFGPKGEFLAENRVPQPATAVYLEGFAVDSARGRVYLLVVDSRPEESEQIRTKIEHDEEKIAKKEEEVEKRRAKSEPTATLEKEIAELKADATKLEEELSVFDPGTPAAAELWSFSTTVNAEKLKEQHLLANSEALHFESELPKGALLDPAGIAVDPVTHDVLIVGQQDESTKKGPGEEVPRAAVQRVHTEGAAAGKLGPRYVDTANCLDEGQTSGGEPACAEGEGRPFSPIVSPGGRLYAERQGGSGEIWEIPDSEGAAEEFKEYATHPKRLYAIGGAEKLAAFTTYAAEEEGGGMAFAPGPTSGGVVHGKIYLDAEILEEAGAHKSLNRGALILDYSEPEAGGPGEAKEAGWTAGQNATGGDEKCALPLSTPLILVGADSEEHLLMLDATIKTEKAASVSVLRFGPEGQGCGHAEATPPSVAVGAAKGVHTVAFGKEAVLSSEVSGANALSAEWRFKDLTTGHEEKAETTADQFQAPTLEHKFTEAGEYEITVVVEPDDFGPKIERHTKITVEPSPVTVDFSHPGGPVPAAAAVKFEAKVTDPEEAPPHVKYAWEFGDGAKAEGSGGREFSAEHAYAAPGTYEVKLKVTDEGGRPADRTYSVQVTFSAQEVKEKEEAIATKQREEREALERKSHEAQEAVEKKKREELEAAEKKKREEQEAIEKKKHEEQEWKAHHPTRGELLTKALKSCKKESRGKRAKCEATARKKYGKKKRKRK